MARKPKADWIADAVPKEREGVFTAKAKRQNKTVAQYAADVLKPDSKADATTRKQASLAQTLTRISRKHKPKKGGK
jgi:hypothetical protein